MRLANQILPKKMTGFIVFALGLLGAYEAATLIIAGDISGLLYIAVIFILAASVIAILNDWRLGLYFFFAWLLLEDLIRKYLGNNMAIYFAKDFLVAVVYLSFFIAWRRKRAQGFRPPFFVPLMIMIWFGVLQVFNPTSPHLAYGMLGMKLYFYYVPLILIGYALLDSEVELQRFFVVNLTSILLVAGLGIAQAIIGPSFMSPATTQEELKDVGVLYRLAPISGSIVFRPTSVFVTTGRYVDLLNIAWLLALGFLGYSLLRYRKGRWLAFLSVSVVAAALILAASRGGFAWGIINAVIFVAAFLWGASWRQREVIRVLRTTLRAGLGIALATVILLVSFPEAILGRIAVYYETMSPDSPASELVQRARDYPLQNFVGAFASDRWPYGYGIGTTALGTQYVTKFFGAPPLRVGVESGFGEIVVEMGIVGLLLWLVLTLAILISVYRIILRMRGSPLFPIACAVFLYTGFVLIPQMVGGLQAYEDFVVNAYFWLLLGLVFRLPHLKAAVEQTHGQSVNVGQRCWATQTD